MRRTRRAFAAVSVLLFAIAAVVAAASLAGPGRPSRMEPAEAPPVASVPPAGPIDLQPIWRTRFGTLPTPPPPPPPPEKKVPRFDTLVRVERAQGGLAEISWAGLEGELRHAWRAPGESIDLSTGETAVLDRIDAEDDRGLRGVVSFRARGGIETLRFPATGKSPLRERGVTPSLPPVDPPAPPAGSYGDVSASRILGPNHWRIAPGEWREVANDLETRLAEVSPAVVYGASGEVAGLRLGEVLEGSLAWERGFRKGDIVHRVMGEPVSSTERIRTLLEEHASSDRVVVEVDRYGTRITMVFELAR